MSIKILIVLCFGVLAIQGYPSNDAGANGDFDNLTEMLKKLEKEVKTAGQNAINTMDENFLNISDTIATIRQISELAYYWRSEFLTTIEQIIDESTSRGVDISNCTAGPLDTLYRFPEKIVANVSTCFDAKYATVQSTMAYVIDEINSFLETIGGYWKEITECQEKSSEEQSTCISKITSQITDDANIPTKIGMLLKEAINHIDSQKTDLFHCYDDEITNYRNKIQDIISAVYGC